MKQTIFTIISCVYIFVIAGCKKSDTTTVTISANTDLLTKQDWVNTGMQYKDVRATAWIDDYAGFKACQKDDRIVYRTNNTYEYNEGPSKCATTDSQIKTTGTWNFAQGETILVVKDAAGAQIYSATIQTLTATSLSISFILVDQNLGGTYQFIETFAH